MSGRLYVGNLPSDVKPEEIGKMFERFGGCDD
jgi:RNA recognition motif-containing protein